eukprot:595442-Rhodomonas_salina.2
MVLQILPQPPREEEPEREVLAPYPMLLRTPYALSLCSYDLPTRCLVLMWCMTLRVVWYCRCAPLLRLCTTPPCNRAVRCPIRTHTRTHAHSMQLSRPRSPLLYLVWYAPTPLLLYWSGMLLRPYFCTGLVCSYALASVLVWCAPTPLLLYWSGMLLLVPHLTTPGHSSASSSSASSSSLLPLRPPLPPPPPPPPFFLWQEGSTTTRVRSSEAEEAARVGTAAGLSSPCLRLWMRCCYLWMRCCYLWVRSCWSLLRCCDLFCVRSLREFGGGGRRPESAPPPVSPPASVYGCNAAVYGCAPAVHGCNAPMYGGAAPIYGGAAPIDGFAARIYGCDAAIYGGGADVFGGAAPDKAVLSPFFSRSGGVKLPEQVTCAPCAVLT